MMAYNQNDSPILLKRLSANDDYYSNVFKKTERIAAVVFYVLSYSELNEKTKIHYHNLSDKNLLLHEAVIASLDYFEYEVSDKIHRLQQALVVLGSTLTLATSARLVSADIQATVEPEIELVLRYIRNHYTSDTNSQPTGSNLGLSRVRPSTLVTRPRRRRPQIPVGDFSSDAILVYSDLSDRTARIRTVLEAKPAATIKDISEIITDVSTKTIQRDLNSLIESGQVIRQGERRWSRYSVTK
jgi:hypothetical protein